MADTEAASAMAAENEKMSTAAAHEPVLNANEAAGDVTAATTKDAATEPKSVEVATEVEKTATVGGASEDKTAAEPSSERKRKHSPADDRDWRDRRDADNRHDRGGDRGRGGRRDDRNGHRGGRGGGRGNFRKSDYSANVRTDFTALPESSDHEEIRKQVEFYFSDSNLPTDKFLLTQVEGSENKPVPVKVIHSFKRMRHFQPYSAVVAALRESTSLNIIGAEGSEEIQRKVALPENMSATNPQVNVTLYEDATRTRSIYVKGFGDETSSTQFDIENFFAPYGPINAVRLRRTFPDKEFKGSVFVEFDSDETQQQFLELENKPKWEEKELKIMSKDEYVKSKVKDIKAGKVRSNRADDDDRGRGRGGRGGRGRGRGSGGRGRGGRGRDHDLDRDGDNRDHGRRNKFQSQSRSRSHSSRSRSRSRSPYRASKTESKEDSKAESAVKVESAVEPTAESKKRTRDEADVDGGASADHSAELKRSKVENAAEAGA